MKRLLKTAEAAEYLGLSIRTLENWRYQGKGRGPKVTPLDRTIRYDLRDLDVWIEEQKESATETK